MINLAGVSEFEANIIVTKELGEAGIQMPLLLEPHTLEVQATIAGILCFKEAFFGFQRAWRYWVVKATKPFPLPKIMGFNGGWGSQARMEGHGYGKTSEEIWESHINGYLDRLSLWHIDTLEALSAFVTFANECYTPYADHLSHHLTKTVVEKNDLIQGTLKEPYRIEILKAERPPL